MRPLILGVFAFVLCMTLVKSGQALSCSIATSGVAFGAYDTANASPLDTVGSITYYCDSVESGDTIIVQLSRGGAATYLPRTLIHGAYQLEYNLYLDAPRTRIWGDGSSSTERLGPFSPANATSTPIAVYGRIAGGQRVHGGSYADTVIVTVVF